MGFEASNLTQVPLQPSCTRGVGTLWSVVRLILKKIKNGGLGVLPQKKFSAWFGDFWTEQASLHNTSNHCTSLNYTLHSKNQKETLKLTVEHSPANDGSFYHDFHHPIITVSLLPCPWGFTLQPDSLYCDCDSRLVRHKILCNINYQTIEWVPPMWIVDSFICSFVHNTTSLWNGLPMTLFYFSDGMATIVSLGEKGLQPVILLGNDAPQLYE